MDGPDGVSGKNCDKFPDLAQFRVDQLSISSAEGSVDIMKIIMISKAMIFYDVKQAVMGNLHDSFMISDLRFLHAEILMLKSAHLWCGR